MPFLYRTYAKFCCYGALLPVIWGLSLCHVDFAPASSHNPNQYLIPSGIHAFSSSFGIFTNIAVSCASS